jgi:hypothetical protein
MSCDDLDRLRTHSAHSSGSEEAPSLVRTLLVVWRRNLRRRRKSAAMPRRYNEFAAKVVSDQPAISDSSRCCR